MLPLGECVKPLVGDEVTDDDPPLAKLANPITFSPPYDPLAARLGGLELRESTSSSWKSS